MDSMPWKIWVDTGGTFTDCIAHTPDGDIKRLKVLSSGVLKGKVVDQINPNTLAVQVNWPVQTDIFRDFYITILPDSKHQFRIESVEIDKSVIRLRDTIPLALNKGDVFEISSEEEVPVFAARLITQTGLYQPFPFIEMKLGSTRGTNALLEKKGARVAFLVTEGFKDLLLIGNQQRKELFSLPIVKDQPLYDSVFEVKERIAANGAVLKPLDEKQILRLVTQVKDSGCDSIAIALLNSYKNPEHENTLAEEFIKNGYQFVSDSHSLSGQIKILQRAETTVANAYLDPIIHNYINRIQQGLRGAQLKIMTSAGGLVAAKNFFPKDSLLSGPAGGVVGAAVSAKQSGIEQLISFDMGGTSTDVSLYDKQYSYRYETKVGEVSILSPSLSIETIAAGGGSICEFDGHRLTVGPHSAGATPGPACYGSGGPLTITDVNLLLGRADCDFFSIPLYLDRSKEALEKLLLKIQQATRKKPKAESVLESLTLIANEKMAEAIKKVSVQQGHDPANYSLLCFGGAGGQHACALAEILNMKQILIPYDAGLLSAFGIGKARIERFEELQLIQLFSDVESKLAQLYLKLFESGVNQFRKDGFERNQIIIHQQLLFLRFKGQESTIEIAYEGGNGVLARFQKIYKAIYGHWITDREIEIESIRSVLCVNEEATSKKKTEIKSYRPAAVKQSKLFINGSWKKTGVYLWEQLRAGAVIKGRALVVSQNSTTVVNDHWEFRLDENNNALLREKKKSETSPKKQNQVAALELFSNRFTAVAQEMGALLQRTSFSVNVKERLDFSCAMMDAEGYLVVNAPHIPVHLGSMGVCVREVKKVISMKEGDVIITNHPSFGGSHLPDVTLIKPVFYKKKLVGYVANRAHHAEIGGKKPGSMPADATTLEEEGVIIPPTYLVKRGKVQWQTIRKIFSSARYPSRLPEENMADLNGALASVNLGETALQELCKKYGHQPVSFYMKALRAYASSLLTAKIKESKIKIYKAEERLDDGSLLKVVISLTKQKLTVDFSGSAKVHPGNLNATRAIVQSVILYVLRLWVNQPIAMNEGLMEPVNVILPTSLLNPDFSAMKLPAVVGGNTEVSQRLTDTLLKAFGLAACSQGTMNNLLFGNDRFGFYETICGGTGAGPGFDGASGVHSHMTNTRITDPESLELRDPVRLEKFEIRKGSGGSGKWKGGDGVVREITFNEKVEVNMLSQHRIEKPYGLKGGQPGQVGQQQLITRLGEIKILKGMDSIVAEPGDRLQIKTPGGGGYGLSKPFKIKKQSNLSR
jgi:5-oxoprolinase (ATP-hydrolysing)